VIEHVVHGYVELQGDTLIDLHVFEEREVTNVLDGILSTSGIARRVPEGSAEHSLGSVAIDNVAYLVLSDRNRCPIDIKGIQAHQSGRRNTRQRGANGIGWVFDGATAEEVAFILSKDSDAVTRRASSFAYKIL